MGDTRDQVSCQVDRQLPNVNTTYIPSSSRLSIQVIIHELSSTSEFLTKGNNPNWMYISMQYTIQTKSFYHHHQIKPHKRKSSQPTPGQPPRYLTIMQTNQTNPTRQYKSPSAKAPTMQTTHLYAAKLNKLPTVNPATRHNPMNPPAASLSQSSTHSPAAIIELAPSHPFVNPNGNSTNTR